MMAGVATRKRAILDVDLAGRDEQLGAAVNEKPQKRGIYTKKAETLVSAFCVYQIGSVLNQF